MCSMSRLIVPANGRVDPAILENASKQASKHLHLCSPRLSRGSGISSRQKKRLERPSLLSVIDVAYVALIKSKKTVVCKAFFDGTRTSIHSEGSDTNVKAFEERLVETTVASSSSPGASLHRAHNYGYPGIHAEYRS